jgi:hypothetical protein
MKYGTGGDRCWRVWRRRLRSDQARTDHWVIFSRNCSPSMGLSPEALRIQHRLNQKHTRYRVCASSSNKSSKQRDAVGRQDTTCRAAHLEILWWLGSNVIAGLYSLNSSVRRH